MAEEKCEWRGGCGCVRNSEKLGGREAYMKRVCVAA